MHGGPLQSTMHGGVVGAPPPNPPMGPPGPHPVFGGPPYVASHRAAGAPMMGSYPNLQGGATRDMQQYPPVFGSPMQDGGGAPFRGPPPMDSGCGPQGPLRARRPGAPGGPLPDAPSPFILRTPRAMPGPPMQGPPQDVPGPPPPPDPSRGLCGVWYGRGPPPPPFRHPGMGAPGGPGVPGAPMAAAALKKRKVSANKAKAKKQKKLQQQQQQQRQQQTQDVLEDESGVGLNEGDPGSAPADQQQLQQQQEFGTGEQQERQDGEQQEEEEDEQQQQQEEQEQQQQGDEDGAAAGDWERTAEQQSALSDYFASKTQEFLSSEAYLEGWSKKDLIEVSKVCPLV